MTSVCRVPRAACLHTGSRAVARAARPRQGGRATPRAWDLLRSFKSVAILGAGLRSATLTEAPTAARQVKSSGASSARCPSPTSFGVLGLTRARRSFSARQQGRLARRRQEWSRALFSAVRATPRSPISHMRARSRHTGVASMAARETDGRREQQRERVSVGCPGGTTTARATAAARLSTHGRGGRARRRRPGKASWAQRPAADEVSGS